MRVLAPGGRAAALGNQRTELRVGEDVHPGCGRHAAPRNGDDVFAPVRREATLSIVEQQFAPPPIEACTMFVTAVRNRPGCARFRRDAVSGELSRERSAGGVENDASRGVQHGSIGFAHAGCRKHENAARLVHGIGVSRGGDQRDDVRVQRASVLLDRFFENHEVRRHSMQPPELACLQHLADQVDVGGIRNPQQHDRQIAGDPVAPQRGLALASELGSDAVRVPSCIGVNDGACKSQEALRIGIGCADRPQDRLLTRRTASEGALGERRLTASGSQREACVA